MCTFELQCELELFDALFGGAVQLVRLFQLNRFEVQREPGLACAKSGRSTVATCATRA